MKELSDLAHTRVTLPRGGQVVVLDNGAVIGAEAEAMLQALHSRSIGGLDAHLKVLEEKGAAKFMESYYVGYGHKSIGDCGTGTLFIEGVSMLAAKAIQDSPLYSGQEASTRYIDFSEQPFINPAGTPEGEELLEMQRRFYLQAQPPTVELLKKQHPKEPGESDLRYNKAIEARAFDITRGLLPAGASTNLAWHTNLRQAADHLLFLRHHPLEEVRETAQGIEEALQTHYPNSFGHKRYPGTEMYQKKLAEGYYYHDPNSPEEPTIEFDGIDRLILRDHKELLDVRPPKTELPKFLGEAGTMVARFQLDYGSFRDVQRHRAIRQRMPLLTTELGFNKWYKENLPTEMQGRVEEHLKEVRRKITSLGLESETTEQYYIPMGYNVACTFTGDVPATTYMIELRDSRFVHPTLQKVAHTLGITMQEELGIPLHTDKEPNRFDTKRGDQDITLKND